MTPAVLRVQGLRVRYHTSAGAVKAAADVSFEFSADERLGLAGESGSGKSTTVLAILRMIKPPGRVEAGAVWLDDLDLMTLSEEQMRQVRLARIALIPQGSMNSLNPLMRIKDQIDEEIADALNELGDVAPGVAGNGPARSGGRPGA